VDDAESQSLVIGRIGGVYGIKGWVRIHSYTEPVDNLLGYRNWTVQRQGKWEAICIDAGKRHGKGLVAHLEGVDDRSQAEALKGCAIAVPITELPELAEEEYYWHQLEGLSVECAGELLGRVDQLMATGANDVMVVKPCEGSRDQRERLIPWIRGSVVKNIDLLEGSIQVDWDLEF
jgi:16S rRNA processing protein RimM